ncbi:MAG TPA: hypothetical protein VFR64_14945 [Methylomirabilota bacterium]|nr:hypothetical protein [Methylomirabilota bacterium]
MSSPRVAHAGHPGGGPSWPTTKRIPDTIKRSSPKARRTWAKAELYQRAQELQIEGRSRISKKELARAIARRQ